MASGGCIGLPKFVFGHRGMNRPLPIQSMLDNALRFPLHWKKITSLALMTELQFYVPGLRTEEKMMQFNHQTDILAARCKVDAPHDMIYFEIDDPSKITLRQITELFDDIGLVPRLVGTVPSEIRRDDVG